VGPIFSLFLAAIAGAVLTGVTYCVLRFWHSAGRSVVLAIASVSGAGLGFLAAIVAAIPIVGSGGTLESSAAVMSYLAWLAMGGLGGGILAASAASRVLTKRARTPEAS
jgi:hypothetical protein